MDRSVATVMPFVTSQQEPRVSDKQSKEKKNLAELSDLWVCWQDRERLPLKNEVTGQEVWQWNGSAAVKVKRDINSTNATNKLN